MDFSEIVRAELIAHDITLCTECERYHSHRRGFAVPDKREIHYAAKCATRKTLHGFLHEVGHVIKGHGKACQLKRFEREAEAERYATESLRMYGIAVPREAVALGKRYVARWKSLGKRISRGRKEAAAFWKKYDAEKNGGR